MSETATPAQANPTQEADITSALGRRSVVLVGMMGVGKSTIGRKLAQLLDLPFRDADDEIEKAAQLSIGEIFERFGEAHFRDGERRVIARLLDQALRLSPAVVPRHGQEQDQQHHRTQPEFVEAHRHQSPTFTQTCTGG